VALVSLSARGEYVEADLCGYIPSDHADEALPHIDRGLHVLGYQQTDQATGVEGNIVQNGVICLDSIRTQLGLD
jgi:hypothetical protein